MGRRFWIILGVVLIIGLAVFIFLIWQKQAENRKAPSEELAIGEKVQPSQQPVSESRKEPVRALAGDNLVIEESKGLEFKPFFDEEGEKFKETFLEQFSALSNPPISISQFAPEFFPSQSTSIKKEQPIVSVPEATSTEIILSLTDDEFHFLYPDIFIASLMEAQNLFIKEYDLAYEPLLKIETDSHVRFIEEKIVAGLLSAGMITEEEAERFITTIRFTLPQLQLTELKNRKSLILNQSFILSPSSSQPLSKGLFFAGLIERLYIVFIPEAQAKVCGYCYRTPVCFQVGLPSPVGFNIWKAFCYCTGCYYGQGCLDFCEGMSAIWDPMTGICGCG